MHMSALLHTSTPTTTKKLSYTPSTLIIYKRQSKSNVVTITQRNYFTFIISIPCRQVHSVV